MSLALVTTEPREFTKGETVTWTVSYSDFPADDGWSLTYYFRGPGTLDTIATPSGSSFVVLIPAADTASFIAGLYQLTGFVEKVTVRKQVYTGQVEIHEDPTQIEGGFDPRSHAQKCLDAINATLEGRASRSDSSYQIAGRSIVHYSFEDLLKMKDYYASLVAAEDAARTGNVDKYIYARFREWR